MTNPVIKGELLPWAIPEKPIKRPTYRVEKDRSEKEYKAITYTDYVHLTSISPRQTAKLLLYDFVPVDSGTPSEKYLVRFYSEYGAPGPADPAPRYYRACLYLDTDKLLKVRVTVAGKGLRKPLEFRFTVRKDALDGIVKYSREGNMDRAIDALKRAFGQT